MKPGANHVLIADKQPLTAAGMVRFLEGRDGMTVIGPLMQRSQLADTLQRYKPALMIADYNIPGYITVHDLVKVVKNYPDTNLLIVSSDSNKKNIVDVLQLGVKGFITKECSENEVLAAVDATLKGEKFFCQKVLNIIMEKSFAPEPTSVAEQSSLTARETEILTLLAKGRSTQQIADELFLSPHTVHTHRKSIIRKLNIKSPTEYVIYAMDKGLLTPR